MKIVNIYGENPHISWMTPRISKNFSEKMLLMIILKVTRKQGFNISPLHPQEGGSTSPPPAFLELIENFIFCSVKDTKVKKLLFLCEFYEIFENTFC